MWHLSRNKLTLLYNNQNELNCLYKAQLRVG